MQEPTGYKEAKWINVILSKFKYTSAVRCYLLFKQQLQLHCTMPLQREWVYTLVSENKPKPLQREWACILVSLKALKMS